MSLYNTKKLERKEKLDHKNLPKNFPVSFGKKFNYEYGREKAKKIAESKTSAIHKALNKHK